MSLIGELSDAAVAVVAVPMAGGTVYARVRRLTSGESLEAGAGGLVAPADPLDGKRRVKAKNDGIAAIVDGAKFTQHVLWLCVLAIGKTRESLEPCTVLYDESKRERVGTHRLPGYSLPAATESALFGEIMALTGGEDWRHRVASFLHVGPPGDRPDGQEVARAPNGAT